MSFLDKAKEKATQLTQQAKEKIDDIKDNRKADELLDDLGRILYRSRTERAEAGDEARIAELVTALQTRRQAEGADVLPKPKPAETPANSFPPPATPAE